MLKETHAYYYNSFQRISAFQSFCVLNTEDKLCKNLNVSVLSSKFSRMHLNVTFCNNILIILVNTLFMVLLATQR